MSELQYMVGPGLSLFRSEGDLTITFNATRSKAVDIELKLYDILIPLLGVLIIAVNGVIVASSGLILYRGQQPRATYLFLGNVALADLIIGIAILFGLYYPRSKRTETICAVEIGMTVSSALASVYSIGLIDRFLYILYGLRYQRYIYPNRARLMIVSVWTLALIIGYLPAMGYRADTKNGKVCWFIVIEPPELVLATTSIGLVPLIVVIVLYGIILHHALRKISQLKAAAKSGEGANSGNLRIFRGGIRPDSSVLSVISDTQPAGGISDPEDLPLKRCCGLFKRKSGKIQITPVYNPSRWKAIKIVALTTGCYFVTLFPYFVASAMHVVCDLKSTPKFCDGLRVAIASPLAILGISNSLLNPIIYAWWHNGFRESLKKICGNWCGQDRLTCKNENSSASRSTGQTRITFLRRSNQQSDVEISDNEANPIIRSRAKSVENLQPMAAQHLRYNDPVNMRANGHRKNGSSDVRRKSSTNTINSV